MRERGPLVGGRNLEERQRRYVEAALDGEADAVASAPRGERNAQLYMSAFKLSGLVGGGWLDAHTVAGKLEAAAAHLTAEDGIGATRATIKSGLNAGLRHPRNPPNDADAGGAANAYNHVQDFTRDAEDDCGLKWHGEPDDTPLKEWLVYGILPKRGVAILAGQWGSYKSFVVLDLSGAVMTQGEFAGRSVMRCGDVLFLACEGEDEVRIRLTAMAAQRAPQIEKLPFAWREECPKLTDPDALPKLRKIMAKAATVMRERFGVDLALMAIDTLMAGADFKDANDAAEAQRVFRMLNTLALEHSMLVLAVDHFGKDVTTGTRNSSAKEGAAEAVLALLAERDTASNVSNPRMAIRKVRGAQTGVEIKFLPRVVEVSDGPMMRFS